MLANEMLPRQVTRHVSRVADASSLGLVVGDGGGGGGSAETVESFLLDSALKDHLFDHRTRGI